MFQEGADFSEDLVAEIRDLHTKDELPYE